MFKHGAMDALIKFSRIYKGSNKKFEHPNLWNTRALDYKNFTASWKNFTIVSNRMDPSKYMHYIQDLNLGKYTGWNQPTNYGEILIHDILNYRGRTLTLW